MIQIYAINLKTRPDRLYHITQEVLKIKNNKIKIVEAIIDTNPESGCFKSHQKAIKLAQLNNLERVLILEDDAVFTDNAQFILKQSLEQLSLLQWDMLFLGANLQAPAYRVSNNLIKLTRSWCAHAYIVHNSFYSTILKLPDTYPIDVHYANLMLNNNIYLCNPLIAYQLPSHSNIQNGFRDYNEAIDRNFLENVKI
jgi:GR25 family glycosyltransferase involved in LPS biosynthesis